MIPAKTTERREFYSSLAPYYDQIYGFIDYRKQARLFDILFKRFGSSGGKKLLDLCCGTGSHMVYLKELGYVPTGFDISADMLAVARQKLPYTPLIQGDLRDLKLSERFDFISCWFNSILYSRPKEVFMRTVKQVWAALDPGGVFLFDVVDKRIGIGAAEKTYESCESGIEITFRPRWFYRGTGEDLELVIRFTFNGKDGVKEWVDRHLLCALTFAEVEEMMRSIGFETSWFDKNYEAPVARAGDGYRSIVVCKKTE